MHAPQITFDNGAAYEGYMGVWSRLVGEEFLRWLAPPAGGRWVDVGCGNGAFTELLLDRGAASHVEGVDPSEDQLAFAREPLANRPARFQVGDATALPFADAAFETREITVQRSFDDFATFWRVAQTGPRVAPRIAAMAKGDVERLEERLRSRLLPDAAGRITFAASANAVRGRAASRG